MSFLIFLTLFGSIIQQDFVCGGNVLRNTAKASNGLWATLDGKQPLIFAHRGEKILMPEHTIGSYEIASIEGADYVEPDLVLTKDGRLVCFHDLSIGQGTDVATNAKFENKRKNFTNTIGGVNQTIYNDWFIHDFELAELQELHVTQLVRGIRPQLFNDIFQIPTFEDYLDVIHKMAFLQKRPIGVIPELKNPQFHNSLWSHIDDNYMETEVLNTLKQYGYPIKAGDVPNCNYVNISERVSVECGNVIIQSFEFDTIKYLKTQTDIDLLVLVNAYDLDLLTYDGLIEVANVAKHFHLSKELLYTGIEAAIQRHNIPYNKTRIDSLGGFIPPEEFVEEGHKHNLKIGLYTIYDSHENTNRGCDIVCEPQDKEKDLFYYFELGVDGVFVENVQEAIALRTKFEHNLQMQKLTNAARTLAIPSKLIYSSLIMLFMIICK